MESKQVENRFLKGFQDGIPIGLGYLSVSVAFGIMAVSAGLPIWAAVVISMLNVTSAGQFAGLPLLVAASSPVEMALTQFVINLFAISINHSAITISPKNLSRIE